MNVESAGGGTWLPAADERLPARLKLHRGQDFEHAYRDGGRASGRFLVVVAVRNQIGHARLGISAPKRIGSAVVRNRVRRRLRELFRRDRELIGRPVDLVVNLKPESADAPFLDLRGDFERACQTLFRRLRL